MSSKTALRRRRILSLVRDISIPDQDSLVNLLEKEGFHVTQSSVSRDITALGLVKAGGRYLPSWEVVPSWSEILSLVLDIQSAGSNLLVVKTPPGGAQRVAVALDRSDIRGLIGTVAGDDNVFVACSGKKVQAQIKKRLAMA